MKKTVAICLILCALLCGCQKDAGAVEQGDGTTAKEEQNTSVNNGTAGDGTNADATRLSYYEQLVGELQAEILNLKTVIYANRVEYESRLEALQTGKDETEPPTSDVPTTDQPTGETVTAQPYRYTVAEGRATLTAYLGTDKSVTIPSEIDGYPVTAIGDRCFLDNATLTDVTIPTGVTHIGWFAFSGCVALKSVQIPETVAAIDYGAFQNCDAKMTVACAAGSYAERYAHSYGMAVVRP